MELLLDTHIVLWLFSKDKKLSKKAIEMIFADENECYYSIASMWEVAIKHSTKKMTCSGVEFLHKCEQAGFHKLSIDDRHVKALESLHRDESAAPHNDPFDRILISQAKADSLLLLTHDSKFSAYNEPCVMVV